jgi:hypothetical protein
LWLRLDVIEKVQQLGPDVAVAAVKPTERTICRWLDRVQPYEMITAGRPHTKLVGRDQMLLAIYLVAYPDAGRRAG